jgi:hypothetical protein
VTHASDDRTVEQPAVEPTVSTAPPPSSRVRRWWSSIPSHLGPARTSTVVLAVLFLALGSLYLTVRPDPAATTSTPVRTTATTPAAPSAPPATTAPTTTTPTEPVPTTTEEDTPSPTEEPTTTDPTEIPTEEIPTEEPTEPVLPTTPAPTTAPPTATTSSPIG